MPSCFSRHRPLETSADQRHRQASAWLAEAAAITLGGPGLAYHISRRWNARRYGSSTSAPTRSWDCTAAVHGSHLRSLFTEAQSLAMNARSSVTSACWVVEPIVDFQFRYEAI